MFRFIPIFYILSWPIAYYVVDPAGVSVKDCLIRGWIGTSADPVFINRIALGVGLLAYAVSWVARRFKSDKRNR